MNNAPVCPSCGQLDSVQKVSALYNQGVSSQSVELRHPTGTAKGYVTSTTNLSAYLSPPQKPSLTNFYGGIFAGVLMGVVIIGILLSPRESFSFTIVIFGAVSVFSFVYAAVEKKRYDSTLPQWEHAQRKWGSVFYCARCDGVFTKQENSLISISRFRQWLNQ